MDNIQPPHVGNLLREYVKKNRIYLSGWARKSGLTPKTVGQYLKQPTMQVDTLYVACLTLNYNFLRQIADTLPPGMPPVFENPLQARITELEKQNSDLQLQIKTLERALQLIGK